MWRLWVLELGVLLRIRLGVRPPESEHASSDRPNIVVKHAGRPGVQDNFRLGAHAWGINLTVLTTGRA